MRCENCQADPLARPGFCECCGRPQPAAHEEPASDPYDEPGDRESIASLIEAQPPIAEPEVHAEIEPDPVPCESCGGPVSGAGSICSVCEGVFRKVLESKSPQAHAPDHASAATPSSPPAIDPSVSAVPSAAPIEIAPSPAPPAPPAAAKAPARRASTPPLPKPSTRMVSVEGLRNAAVLVLAAAGSVAAIAWGLEWLDRQWAVVSSTPVQAIASAAPADAGSASSTSEPSIEPSPTSGSAGAVSGSSKSASDAPLSANTRKPAPSAPARRSARTSRQTRRPKSAPAPAPLPARETSRVPEPLPAAAPRAYVPAPAAAPEPEVAPAGPLYEVSQVNEPPRITARVEPRLPDELRDRALNDVVIVRVLVSHVGRASTVNVLRKSKAGPELDRAVVAAVKQWTFQPARRRGQAVSCWYNLGVPFRPGT